MAADPAKDIKIEAGDKPGTQKVTFKSTKKITKKAAVAAIGDKADRFVVKNVKEAKKS